MRSGGPVPDRAFTGVRRVLRKARERRRRPPPWARTEGDEGGGGEWAPRPQKLEAKNDAKKKGKRGRASLSQAHPVWNQTVAEAPSRALSKEPSIELSRESVFSVSGSSTARRSFLNLWIAIVVGFSESLM